MEAISSRGRRHTVMWPDKASANPAESQGLELTFRLSYIGLKHLSLISLSCLVTECRLTREGCELRQCSSLQLRKTLKKLTGRHCVMSPQLESMSLLEWDLAHVCTYHGMTYPGMTTQQTAFINSDNNKNAGDTGQ